MAKKKQSLEEEVAKIIKRMDKEGKTIDEIDEVLVYDVQVSPEFSWKMIKNTLGLKLKKVV